MAEAEGVSSINAKDSPAASKAILRIKRKRSVDPADILLVSHALKKPFTEEDRRNSSDAFNPVQRVFRLAGTVSKNNGKSLSQEILTKLSSNNRRRSKMKMNRKNEMTVDGINERLRETKKLRRQTSRYKVISKHRDIQNDPEDIDNNEDDSVLQEMSRLYRLYDVVLDEVKVPSEEQESVDPNAILCNSVKMIREKLHIDEGRQSRLEILEKDFVYDVYCADDNYGALSDMLDIVHLNESQLVTEVSDDDELGFEDEDDSNDESNWRNDYPDEDEWNGSSDEELRYRNESFDFGYDERRMFSRELSSDDDQDFAYGGESKDEYNYEILDEEDF